MKRHTVYPVIAVAVLLAACSNHTDVCTEYTDLQKRPQECRYVDRDSKPFKQENAHVPTDDDAEGPAPDDGTPPDSDDHGPDTRDDNGGSSDGNNGHGNDPGKHDPSNPGKGKDRDHGKGKGHGKHG